MIDKASWPIPTFKWLPNTRSTRSTPAGTISKALIIWLTVAWAILWVALGASPSIASDDLNADHSAIGERSYAMHCASCHGANLEGQPNWMRRLPNGRLPAPPHDKTGHTWHHTDDELFKITKFGLSAIVPDYESDMPAYKSVLSDKEIFAVLEYIKSRWPARERRYQYNRTRKLKQ